MDIGQIKVNTGRTVVDLYKFLKEHATIPFNLKKAISVPKDKLTKTLDSKVRGKSSGVSSKEEL